MFFFNQNPILFDIQTRIDSRYLVAGNTWGAKVKSLGSVRGDKFLSGNFETLIALATQESRVATDPALTSVPLNFGRHDW